VNIIILDIHPPEDSRIKRHIRYLLDEGFNVYSINLNRHYKDLKEGAFSRAGESGYRKNLYPDQKGMLRTLRHNSYLLSPGITHDIFHMLQTMGMNLDLFTIIHVHDPCLLPAAKKVKQRLAGAKIVYDRHEAYEKYDMPIPILGRTITQVHRSFEKMASRSVDGVVTISDDYVIRCREFFPNAIVTAVPNFSNSNDYSSEVITSKISCYEAGSVTDLVYFGSLGNELDRDIDLIMRIAEDTLSHFQNVRFFMGGHTNNELLLMHFDRLSQEYPGRFQYLGYTPRSDVASITQGAHIGFFLLRPDALYWVKCSPNKIFEYLACGVIPVIRADCYYSDDLVSCSLMYDKSAPDENIILGVRELISGPDLVKGMMERAFNLHTKFSFESVQARYLQLYQGLQGNMNEGG